MQRKNKWLKWALLILIILFFTIPNPLLDKGKSYFSNTLEEKISFKGEDFFDNEMEISLVEKEILILVNKERQRTNAGKLKSLDYLNNFARQWSNKMISQNFLEHSKLNFNYKSLAAENIAEVPIHSNVIGCDSTYSEEEMAECFVKGWIESQGHHKNMVDKLFSLTGVGVSCDESKCRATQVFSNG